MSKSRSGQPEPGSQPPADARSWSPAGRGGMAADYLAGRILIAMPGIDDPRFERTVLMVCLHDEEQAMAIAVNRPLDGVSVGGLLTRMGLHAATTPEARVFYGGPVERSRGYVLHSDDYRSPESTLPVAPGVVLTDTRDILEALTEESRRPRRSLFALGYAGWGAGQLDRELREGVWLTCDPDEDLLFGRDHEGKWLAALAKIGVSPDKLSIQAGRA